MVVKSKITSRTQSSHELTSNGQVDEEMKTTQPCKANPYKKALVKMSCGKQVRRDVFMKSMLRTLKRFLRMKYIEYGNGLSQIQKKRAHTFFEDVASLSQNLFKSQTWSELFMNEDTKIKTICFIGHLLSPQMAG